jgi:hypothetical protein
MNVHENIVCAVPLANKGISIYILDSIRKKFGPDYTFYLRENKDTMECEVWVRTNFEVQQNVLDVIRGKSNWRA